MRLLSGCIASKNAGVPMVNVPKKDNCVGYSGYLLTATNVNSVISIENRFFTRNSEAERWRKAMEEGMSILPLSDYKGEPLYKIVFIADHESDLAEAKQLYEDQFIFCESRLGDNPSAIVNGELINRKFNKGTGIKAICDELGCSLADTIGFGDSDNDLQMTDVVGISVCMANGSDNLKKLCDRICPAVTEDGVARELKTLGLI